MIDELKALLDALANTPNMALYGLGLFITWKLVVYLSTAGSIVYVLKLAINKWHDYKHAVVEYQARDAAAAAEAAANPPDLPLQEYTFGGRLLGGDETKDELSNLLYRVASHRSTGVLASTRQYVHTQDVSWMRKAIEAAIEAEEKA
jgi:hypothetical protein